jgi:hypothetical protein
MNPKFERTSFGVAYITDQADGALPNGTRVVKCTFEKGDKHAIGDLATVIGSIRHPTDPRMFYFVEWDDMPGVPIGVIGTKIRALE